jgi:hypothetical protein
MIVGRKQTALIQKCALAAGLLNSSSHKEVTLNQMAGDESLRRRPRTLMSSIPSKG